MAKATVKRAAGAEPVYRLSADMLRLAHLWRGVTRPKTDSNLRFIHAEPHPRGGAYVLGSDGAAMFIGYDRAAKIPAAVNIALPTDLDLDDLLRGATIDSRYVMGTRSTFAVFDGEDVIVEESYAWILPGNWPNWKKVMPTEEQFTQAQSFLPRTMNADYLKRIGMMYASMGEHRAVNFCTRGLGETIMVVFPWNLDMFVYLAKMDGRVPPMEYPRWLLAGDVEDL